MFQKNPSPFNVFLLQTLMEDTVEDEGDELVVRYNQNGIEMNEEGFQKISAEIALAQRIEACGVREHQRRLMKRPDQVLSMPRIAPSLAAYA